MNKEIAKVEGIEREKHKNLIYSPRTVIPVSSLTS